MNPLINHLKGEQLMNQLTLKLIDQETYRNQRLSFTAKTLEERIYHQKEVNRLKRKKRSTINLNKKKINDTEKEPIIEASIYLECTCNFSK